MRFQSFSSDLLVVRAIKVSAVMIFGVYCFFATWLSAKQLQKIHEIKQRDHYEYDDSDLSFENPALITKVVILCFCTSILSGTVGLAGGMIMSPLFLSLGVLPEVSAATN